ncbi:unnamed protein product [Ascophyllum nodosum]
MKLPRNNNEFVDYMKKHGMVKTPAILEAFRAVDRGDFATPDLSHVAYLNRPVQHQDVHLSAPFIYADALEELRPKPGMSFLNIGSGTCYLSYLVSMLIGELGVNHGVELSAKLLEHSARCIAATDVKLGRKTDIQVIHGNGLHVAADSGYDCVYVGAGCDAELTLPYLQGLLNVGGVLVAPFGEELVRVQRTAENSFSRRSLCNVCFSPIIMPNRKDRGMSDAQPPAVRFVVRPWSPVCHSVYPPSFRKTVVTVLMANNRKDSLPSLLPPALWMEIMSFARRDWFSETARLVEREARAKAAKEGGGCSSSVGAAAGKAGAAAGAVSSSCLGAAKTMALMPVKAGSVAANQARVCNVSFYPRTNLSWWRRGEGDVAGSSFLLDFLVRDD